MGKPLEGSPAGRYSGQVHIVWIAVFGALGAVLRYSLSIWLASPGFPWATLTANLLGCYALGVIFALWGQASPPSPLTSAVQVGLLGALTTFSTFSFEVWGLVSRRLYAIAALYLGISVLAGVLLIGAGMAAGRLLKHAG